MAEFSMLRQFFLNVEPFRRNMLSILSPHEIAKLRAALNCDLTPAEWKRHMNILDDIFEDATPIRLMQKLGMTVRIFGADLDLLERRIRNPCEYLKTTRHHHRDLNLFIL